MKIVLQCETQSQTNGRVCFKIPNKGTEKIK